MSITLSRHALHCHVSLGFRFSDITGGLPYRFEIPAPIRMQVFGPTAIGKDHCWELRRWHDLHKNLNLALHRVLGKRMALWQKEATKFNQVCIANCIGGQDSVDTSRAAEAELKRATSPAVYANIKHLPDAVCSQGPNSWIFHNVNHTLMLGTTSLLTAMATESKDITRDPINSCESAYVFKLFVNELMKLGLSECSSAWHLRVPLGPGLHLVALACVGRVAVFFQSMCSHGHARDLHSR
jgi:hypothetical protein